MLMMSCLCLRPSEFALLFPSICACFKPQAFPIFLSIWQHLWRIPLTEAFPRLGRRKSLAAWVMQGAPTTSSVTLTRRKSALCNQIAGYQFSFQYNHAALLRLCVLSFLAGVVALRALNHFLSSSEFSIFPPLWVWLPETSSNHLPSTAC